MSLLSRLNKTATIERPTENRQSTGEVTLSWSSVGTAPCFLDRLGGSSEQIAVARNMDVTHVAIMPAGTDIKPAETNNGLGDRVTIDSVKYLAQFADDVAGQGKHFEVYLRRSA